MNTTLQAVHYTMTGVGLALVIGSIGYAIYDFILVVFFGKSSTISQYMIAVGFSAPFVVFTFGYIAGHLWSSMYSENCVAAPPLTMPWFQIAQGFVLGLIAGYLAKYFQSQRAIK
jgi:hypothetical protein